MQEYIAFDSHKRYTLAEREQVETGRTVQERIEHRPGAIREYLRDCPEGVEVAVEAMGSWYWIVEEIEQAGKLPRLVHPRKAKLMMGMINKTDKLDVHGLNRLQRNGTLPTVWIASGELRDLRELTRTRMVISRQCTRLKNRISATLSKYGLVVEGFSDAFGRGAREQLLKLIRGLPTQTSWTSELLIGQLNFIQDQLDQHEQRVKQLVKQTESMRLLKSLPGVGAILAAVMALEIGQVDRFASAERFASYCGTTPRVSSSGGKTRYGPLRTDVNQYLKWAMMEAANVVGMNHRRGTWPEKYVSQLYVRLRRRKGHAKAIGAVARHLAESAWWMLTRGQMYKERSLGRAMKV